MCMGCHYIFKVPNQTKSGMTISLLFIGIDWNLIKSVVNQSFA